MKCGIKLKFENNPWKKMTYVEYVDTNWWLMQPNTTIFHFSEHRFYFRNFRLYQMLKTHMRAKLRSRFEFKGSKHVSQESALTIAHIYQLHQWNRTTKSVCQKYCIGFYFLDSLRIWNIRVTIGMPKHIHTYALL